MVRQDTSKVSLRPEAGEDRDFLLALYSSTRENELKSIGWTAVQIELFLQQQFDAQYLSWRNLYPDAQYQIVELQGQPIGRLYLHRGEDEYRLIDIALLPEFRNQGLGQYLMRNILQSAAQTLTPVTLHVDELNIARGLYARMGFVEVEKRSPYVFMRWHPDGVA